MALVLVVTPAVAGGQTNPYAGQETRQIKALSPEEVESYRSGSGMGLAKAAELNRHPGPKHVLELADKLGLSESQRKAVQASFDRMHARAVDLGLALVAEERALDGAFAEARLDTSSLAERVRSIARLQGDLRLAHLTAHLETRAVLTAEQVAVYDRLRGYGEGHGHRHGTP
jgi:Spy/CpxP family protein refolding chaperone